MPQRMKSPNSTVDLLDTSLHRISGFPSPHPQYPISQTQYFNFLLIRTLRSNYPQKILAEDLYFRHNSQMPPDFVATGKRGQNTTNVALECVCFASCAHKNPSQCWSATSKGHSQHWPQEKNHLVVGLAISFNNNFKFDVDHLEPGHDFGTKI